MKIARIVLAATVIVAALTLAACAPDTPARPEPSDAETSPPAPTVAPDPQSTPVNGAELTCESIIPSSVVDNFTSVGWQPIVEPFLIADFELDGLMCKWGNPEVPSDHVQIYGWAPVTDAEATSAQLNLVENGWRREDAPEGVYITESVETANGTDENGYGWTYLFGDGWVKFADTKQSILLVEWPPS